MTRRHLTGIVTAICASVLLPAQTKGAQVRGGGGPNVAPPQARAVEQSAGEIHFSNITVKELILRAYRIAPAQLLGPAWLDNARLDVDAKIQPGAQQDQILKNFLAERFSLTLSQQNRHMKFYAMKVSEGGKSWIQHQPGTSVRENASRSARRPCAAARRQVNWHGSW